MISDKSVCNILVATLSKWGLKEAVLSPGSRNAPLLMEFYDCPDIKTTVITDERSAAFVALGKSQSSNRPVALVCTSGTAMLNYGPAIAEAYYQGIPLIVITADRPGIWIDQDDSQTIRQNGAFVNFCKQSYDLDDNESEDYQWYCNRIVNDAMIVATSDKLGPVHINIHLDAPLTTICEHSNIFDRKIDCMSSDEKLSAESIHKLASLANGRKIMLIAGFHRPDNKLNKAILQFEKLPNVCVLAETISNLHLSSDCNAVDIAISGIPKDQLKSYSPDIVITIGGALISRKAKEFIRNCGVVDHWSLGKQNTTVDCFRKLSLRIDADPENTIKKLAVALQKLNQPKGYSQIWSELRSKTRFEAHRFIKDAPWSDLVAYDTILKNIPSGLNLQLTNGTTIRYAQILEYESPHSSHCNRGVSGIEGGTATAIGAASSSQVPTLLISGDMGASYDIGILGSKIVPNNFKTIIINNSGGGIFRFIPSTKDLHCREELFCAPGNIPFARLASDFGFAVWEANNKTETLLCLNEMFNDNTKPGILVVNTPGELSGMVLTDFFNHLKLNF